jgi:triacylglycerol esterase/lipase EstA (alpha/beta hydrolase family)
MLRPPDAAYLYQPSSDAEIPLEVTAYRVDATVGGSYLAARSQQELSNADELDRRGQDRSVDVYYRATLHAAQALEAGGFPSAEGQSAWQVYHRGLVGLIDAGQRYGRLDPRGQLTLREGSRRVIPINYYGFSWLPGDFNQLALAERFRSRDITNHHASEGLGLALVAVRISPSKDERLFRPRQPFAVTAVLRPLAPSIPAATLDEGEAVLEFYNPLAISAVTWHGQRTPLARDLTAPLAAVVNEAPRQYLRGFTAPTDTSVEPKLIMTERYARGKIPVVFIHGLYSDPITWVDVFNDLRVQPDLYQRFQFWVFRYPTGGVVLESAAQLRAQLALARQVSAPASDDPALDSMVLIGHSLGGLLSKMQIANSYDLLWNQAARQPLEAVRASEQVRVRLARSFFFEPLPFVSRVVFVGTPHRGSVLARRLAGRIGSSLVSFGPQATEEYMQLMNSNRDVFKPAITESRPTTINFLEPDNPFLNALGQMPVNPAVRLHSIVGTGKLSPVGEPGDGVVEVSSARCRGVDSEWFVPAQHEKLHRDPESITEMARILRLHARECLSPEAPLTAAR